MSHDDYGSARDRIFRLIQTADSQHGWLRNGTDLHSSASLRLLVAEAEPGQPFPIIPKDFANEACTVALRRWQHISVNQALSEPTLRIQAANLLLLEGSDGRFTYEQGGRVGLRNGATATPGELRLVADLAESITEMILKAESGDVVQELPRNYGHLADRPFLVIRLPRGLATTINPTMLGLLTQDVGNSHVKAGGDPNQWRDYVDELNSYSPRLHSYAATKERVLTRIRDTFASARDSGIAHYADLDL